jgi:hypothetical protein
MLLSPYDALRYWLFYLCVDLCVFVSSWQDHFSLKALYFFNFL